MNKVLLITLILSFCILTACNSEQSKSEITDTTEQVTTMMSTTEKEELISATEQEVATTIATTVATEQKNTETTQTEPQNNNVEESPIDDIESSDEMQNKSMKMTIDNIPVSVEWEDNNAVQTLKELCSNHPLNIHTSMYGGFEQVGDIGADLPRNDVQITTSSGDIVLYSGNQMVVFYGSNTWSYTRLGHITDKSSDEMTQLLSNSDVVITLSYYNNGG